MNDSNEKEYNPARKREIIQIILIIFLAALLLLTFYSNTIMNRRLAEISTEMTSSGKLTERIRGSGLIESNQAYEVKVDGNKIIDTIMIKSGQEVKKDDILFTIGAEDSEEISAAEDALAALELEYQKALVAPAVDYTSENTAINNARADLNAAIAKRDNFAANQGNIQAAKDNYNYNKSQLNYYTKLQTKLQNVISAIDSDEYTGAPAEYTGELISLKNTYISAENDYNTAVSIYSSLISGSSKPSDNEELSGDNTETAGISEADIEAAKADMEAKEYAKNDAKWNYDDRKYNLRNELVGQLTDAENNADYYTNQISDYEADMSESSSMSLDALNEDVQAKQRALEELIFALNKTKSDNDSQAQINTLTLEAQKKEIEKAKQKVEKLKKENAVTEIKSKYSGIVSSVNIKPGDTTVPDMPVAVIDISDEGYTVKITVDGEKAKKVKTGTEAEVVNNWSGNVQAVLTDIKNDTTAGSKNRILVFSVTGDVDSGTNIDLSIPCGSSNYDAIVPKSAVYQDKDGKFVLTVKSKSSPLGNRYFAEKVNVEVLASDEISSAVQGSISQGDYVITAASKPVSPKDQVRMKD